MLDLGPLSVVEDIRKLERQLPIKKEIVVAFEDTSIANAGELAICTDFHVHVNIHPDSPYWEIVSLVCLAYVVAHAMQDRDRVPDLEALRASALLVGDALSFSKDQLGRLLDSLGTWDSNAGRAPEEPAKVSPLN